MNNTWQKIKPKKDASEMKNPNKPKPQLKLKIQITPLLKTPRTKLLKPSNKQSLTEIWMKQKLKGWKPQRAFQQPSFQLKEKNKYFFTGLKFQKNIQSNNGKAISAVLSFYCAPIDIFSLNKLNLQFIAQISFTKIKHIARFLETGFAFYKIYKYKFKNQQYNYSM